MKPEVGVGIIGYGAMGKAHSYGYTLAARVRELPCVPRLLVISGRTREGVERAAGAYGVERAVTDWREVIDSPASVVIDEAENRLHVQKAIMAEILKG